MTTLSQIAINNVGLVRAADIEQLPADIRETFWTWMAGQTMPHIDGEVWIYAHDWKRFLRWYGGSARRTPGRLAGEIRMADDFDATISEDSAEAVHCDVCGSNTTLVQGGEPQYATLHADWGYGSSHDGERYNMRLCEICFFATLAALGIPRA
jgi:hypothetical protein